MLSKFFPALLAALIVLSGCVSEIPLAEESETSSSTAFDDSTTAMESSASLSVSTYVDQSLGITIRSEAFDLHKLRTEGHKIILDDLESPGIGEMSVYSLEKDQTIESAILKLVSEQGKDPSNCTVRSNGPYWGDDRYTEYLIDLKNSEIAYSKEELQKIRDTEESNIDQGPFDTVEYLKREIYVNRLIDLCSELANPLGLGTSKSVPSRFVFDHKTRFAFLPGASDPVFYLGDHVFEFTDSSTN